MVVEPEELILILGIVRVSLVLSVVIVEEENTAVPSTGIVPEVVVIPALDSETLALVYV